MVGFQSALALAKGVMRIGHAYRIAQCKQARVKFVTAMPVQVRAVVQARATWVHPCSPSSILLAPGSFLLAPCSLSVADGRD